MSTPNKARSDAILKNLSEDRQGEVFQRLTVKTATWKDTSLTAVKEWLALDGVKTSERALSEFCSWYALRQQVKRNESTVETLLAEFKAASPDATPEKVQAVGQAFFSALALETQDIKPWFLAQQVALKKQQQDLDQQKFAESKKDEATKALEYCLDEAKQFPAVQDLFKAAFAALKKAKVK